MKKLMNVETSNGGGGGSAPGGEVAPPSENQQPPVQESQPVQPPAQPAQLTQDNSTAARLAMLEQQNQQLMALLMRQQQMQAPQQESAPEPVDESQLDPVFLKYIEQRDRQWERRLNMLRETVDQSMFQSTVAGKQLPPEALQMAEGVYAQWRQSGTLVRMPDGSMAPPTRQDALRFALGDLALQGKLGPAPKPPLQGTVMRPAAPAPPVPRDFSQMTREERIRAYETKLDEEGF